MKLKISYESEKHIVSKKDFPSFQAFRKALPTIFKSIPKNFNLCYWDEEGDEITIANDSDFDVLTDTGLKVVKISINEAFIYELPEPSQVLEIEDSDKEIEAVDVSMGASNISLNDSIESKFREMLPEIISKVKESVLSESKITEPTSIPAPIPQPKVVHYHITCDSCGKTPIEGIRYKCSICHDFDLCEVCEVTYSHPHPFLKIKTPKQAPAKIFVTLVQDGIQSQLKMNGEKIEAPELKDFYQMGENIFNRLAPIFKQHKQNLKQCFGKRQCPFKKQRKQRCPEQKPDIAEEKPVPKKEEVKEVPVKVEPKKQLQNVVLKAGKIFKFSPLEEEEQLEKAVFLTEILNRTFNECYEFVLENPTLQKEDLINKFFVMKKMR